MLVLMTSTRARTWLGRPARLVLIAWALASACGSGGGGASGPNRGSQCTQVLQVACSKLGNDCMVFPSDQVAACVQSGINSCCGGNCSASVISTQAEIDTCVADINADSCAQLDVTTGGTLPASCFGVVRSALGSATSALSAPGSTSPGARIGSLVSQ